MPQTHYDDESDDEGQDDEGPGEHDAAFMDDDEEGEDDSESDTVPCPACGKQILATAERCHRCGEYFGKEAWLARRSPKQGMWLAVAVMLLIVMLWLLLGWML